MLNNHHKPDWKFIDEISLSLLEEGVGNYDVLQKALPSIVLSKINETSSDCTVERLLKMFRIAQLQIEYVLKTQAELVKQVEDLQNRLKFVNTENSKLRKELINRTETINSLFKCDRCDKLFLHSTFLYDHMKRRHKNEQYGNNE
ncbi:Cilium assembly protein [Dirofilaria immitis]